MSWHYPTNVAGTAPPARAYHTACLVGRKLFIFGGRAGNRYFNDVYVLDTGGARDPFMLLIAIVVDPLVWEKPQTFGSPPSARAYHTAVAVGTKIIHFGGMDGTKCFNEVHILDTGILDDMTLRMNSKYALDPNGVSRKTTPSTA